MSTPLTHEQREQALQEMQELLDRLAAETMAKARDIEELKEQIEELKNADVDCDHIADDVLATRDDVLSDWAKIQQTRKQIQDNLDVYLTPVPLPKNDRS